MRYLTYTPWQGDLNNTRMCFETSLVLAYLSGRCLVMPREYRRRHEPEVEQGRFRPLHPKECFQLESLDGIVPIIEREEYEDRIGGAERRDQVCMNVHPGTAVFCCPKIPAAGTPEALDLHDFAATRRGRLEMNPAMEDCLTLNVISPTLEHFYSFFYCSPPMDAECKRLVRDYVTFPAPILATARRVAASLGNYCAVHVRRGDFLTQYPEQDIPPHRMLDNMLRRLPSGAPLYVATDERDRGFFTAFREHYQITFVDDFRSLLPDHLPAHSLACLEQMICALASVFVGTRLSTFSAYITRLRGYHGAADKNSYFTDGAPGSEMDTAGSPRFSWVNWLRSGNPLWGREFREAWEF